MGGRPGTPGGATGGLSIRAGLSTGFMARAAGTYAQLVGKDAGYAQIKLSSGELRLVHGPDPGWRLARRASCVPVSMSTILASVSGKGTPMLPGLRRPKRGLE